MRGQARVGLILVAFAAFTLPLMPVQALLLRAHTGAARRFPHWYHRQVCRLLGVRLKISGEIVRDRAVLIIANHVSWLDIPVLSAVAPVSFVAKKDVASWPFVSSLARLQRTVFVDRERRSKVGETANEIMDRLGAGDAIVLFPEGTSSDGNRILPFKTSLFAAAKPTEGLTNGAGAARAPVVVQTVTLVYTRRNGLPLGWAGRRRVGYYGDMGMGENAFDLLASGPIEATIHIGTPIALDAFSDRKDLARRSEVAIRARFAQTARGE
jgi:lyso-ornithine lipid O-acyltransferase